MSLVLFIVIILLSVAQLALASRTQKFWLLAPSTLMTSYFILISLPGIFLATDDIAVYRALLAHSIWFAGVLTAVLIVALRSTQLSNLSLDSKQIYGSERVLWIFVLLSIPAVIFTFYMLGRVPLFIGLLGGDSGLSMHAARQMNTLEHKSGETIYFGQGYLREIYTVVSPVFLVALYVLANLSQKRIKLSAVTAMGVFLIVAGALNGQIWLAVHIMLLFFMAKYFVIIAEGRGTKSIAVIWQGLAAYIFLLAFVFLYRYFQFLQGREFENFFLDTIHRIFTAGAVDLFGIFPEREAFRYGSTWLNDLRGMLPGSNQSFAYEVNYLVNGGAWGFTLSPGIVASSYVNFGFIGVFVAAVSFTLIFNWLFLFLTRSNSSVKLAIALYLSHKFTLAMPGDIGSYIVCLAVASVMYVMYVLTNSVFHQLLNSKSNPAP